MNKQKKLLVISVLVLVGALLFSSVSAWASENAGRGKLLAEARKTLERELLPLAGSGFVGITHSEVEGEVIVFVENEQAEERVPRSFEGYTVRTEVTGKIQTLSAPVVEPMAEVSEERKEAVRPLVGGISSSAYIPNSQYVYAGTLGMVTYDNKILSNAHVIAMNPQTGGFLNIGNAILQPGSLDGGESNDRVGELEAYIPIDFDSDAENYADAAIGSIDGGIEASPGEQFDEEGDYWIEGWTEVSQEDIVRKSGRTTGVTTGEVTHTNVSVVIQYGSKSAYFVDQILVEQENWSFTKPGDSGSAVDKDGEFVGLLFAGSASFAVICKAEHIIEELGITMEPLENRYSLTISSTPGGEVTTPGQGMFLYDDETVVELVAVADDHYHFVEWTGDVDEIDDVYDASTTITMNDNYEIIANFALDPGWCSLTTFSTPGGSVTTPGEGIFVYAANTIVPLIAAPGDHYHFVGWTGDIETVGNATAVETTITVDNSYSITANFELNPGWYSLTVSSTEGGSVTEPGEAVFVRAANTTVQLVAVPDEGYEFLRWTGNVSTIADVYAAATNITMNASYMITAQFESWYPEPKALLSIASTRGGSVVEPGEGSYLYPLGADVSLVAQPEEGHLFTGWSGDVETIADVKDPSTTVAMDKPCAIIANFLGTGFCFIATAAYGTPMAEEIQVLREFRDEYMLTNPVGQALVDFYYGASPPIARFITQHPGLKPLVRAGLVPVVALSAVVVNTTPAEKIAILALLALVSVALAVWATRQRDRLSQHS
jgi:hypothetical protein